MSKELSFLICENDFIFGQFRRNYILTIESDLNDNLLSQRVLYAFCHPASNVIFFNLMLASLYIIDQDQVAHISSKYKTQLNLNCTLLPCTFLTRIIQWLYSDSLRSLHREMIVDRGRSYHSSQYISSNLKCQLSFEFLNFSPALSRSVFESKVYRNLLILGKNLP